VTVQPDGYIEKLKINTNLQKNFITAINQIFDPEIVD
jgi:hypothetical protein